ncbi:hypothetical protein SEA_EFRA2_102 [Mycobacterium phage Efra2]|nr:hypothetical protein SEA_EFRA2_102 [Mycobacterium phage Efra2]
MAETPKKASKLPETIGRILAPVGAAMAPIIAERLAQELREFKAEAIDALIEAVKERLPDLSDLDDDVLALIKGAVPDLDQLDDRLRAAIRDLLGGLPFPFKI